MNRKDLLGDQEGSVIVFALVLLVVLTLLGISSINNSNVEMMIATNDRLYRENFYEAEAAAYIAGQLVEDAPALELLAPENVLWLNTRAELGGDYEDDKEDWIKDNDHWDFAGTGQNAVHIDNSNNRLDLLVVREDIAQGSSMDMNAPEIKIEFTLFGRYLADASVAARANPGRSIIAVGYLKKVSTN